MAYSPPGIGAASRAAPHTGSFARGCGPAALTGGTRRGAARIATAKIRVRGMALAHALDLPRSPARAGRNHQQHRAPAARRQPRGSLVNVLRLFADGRTRCPGARRCRAVKQKTHGGAARHAALMTV